VHPLNIIRTFRCSSTAAHSRWLYAAVTDAARVAAALLATRLSYGRLASPFTAREVYRQEWTGLTEPRVVQGSCSRTWRSIVRS